MDELRRLVKGHEGKRLFPYVDTVGKVTIGYGRNLTDVGVSTDEAELLFEHDLQAAIALLDRELPWAVKLDVVRRAVLIDLSFNLGPRLQGFKNTLEALRSGDWERAAAGLLRSRYARQTGRRARRLAAMLRTGKWPADVLDKPDL